MISAELQRQIRKLAVLEKLDDQDFDALLPYFHSRHLRSGDVLLKQGDQAEALFFLISGRLRTWREDDGISTTLSELTAGESVGEYAVLTQRERYANVIAIRDSLVVGLDKQGFEAFAEDHPKILRELTALLIVRITESKTMPTKQYVRTLALLPLTDKAPVDALSKHIAEAIDWSRCYCVCHSEYRHQREQLGSEQRLLAWLNDLELKYDIVIYVSEKDDDWQALCLRQADKVLWLADAKANPEQPLDALPCLAGQELALLHGERIEPGRTQRWLSGWPCDEHPEHYPLRRAKNSPKDPLFLAEDVARLARLLTGHALGLVFGGGGARGFAHIGVLRYLEDQGYEVDLVGGTSMGAVLAAGVAAGLDSYGLEKAARKLFVDNNYLRHYTLPIISLLSIRRFQAALREICAGLAIEDLPKPYFCISANLSRAEMKIHRAGPLYRAIGASMSIPGVAPPQISNGDLLVDGGILNNLPVDIMAARRRGPVLGSDVLESVEMRVSENTLNAPSGWRALWQRITRQQPRFPSAASIIYRSAVLASIQQDRDLHEHYPVICNEISDIGLFDWKAIDKVIELGYAEAAIQIPKMEEFQRAISKTKPSNSSS